MLKNTYERLLEETQTKNLIVFGCGKYFEDFLLRYPALNGKIDFILDNKRSRDKYMGNGLHIPIISPKEINKINIMNYVIIFCAVRWREMKKQLDEITRCSYSYYHFPVDVDYRKNKELGINHRIIMPAVKVLREHATISKALEITGTNSEGELIKRLEKKEVHTIPRLVVVLTPKCSLRCKECNNLMWAFSGNDAGGGA